MVVHTIEPKSAFQPGERLWAMSDWAELIQAQAKRVLPTPVSAGADCLGGTVDDLERSWRAFDDAETSVARTAALRVAARADQAAIALWNLAWKADRASHPRYHFSQVLRLLSLKRMWGQPNWHCFGRLALHADEARGPTAVEPLLSCAAGARSRCGGRSRARAGAGGATRGGGSGSSAGGDDRGGGSGDGGGGSGEPPGADGPRPPRRRLPKPRRPSWKAVTALAAVASLLYQVFGPTSTVVIQQMPAARRCHRGSTQLAPGGGGAWSSAISATPSSAWSAPRTRPPSRPTNRHRFSPHYTHSRVVNVVVAVFKVPRPAAALVPRPRAVQDHSSPSAPGRQSVHSNIPTVEEPRQSLESRVLNVVIGAFKSREVLEAEWPADAPPRSTTIAYCSTAGPHWRIGRA